MLALTPWTKRTALLPRTENPMGWVGEELAPLFERFFTRWLPMEDVVLPIRYPLTFEEKEKEVVVRVELPGFAPEEVKVETKGELLTIEAEHKEGAEKAGEGKNETAFAHVKRAIELPVGIDMEKVEAIFRHGVLEVRLPRKPEVLPKKIEVKA
jgi:HSP20 family protein